MTTLTVAPAPIKETGTLIERAKKIPKLSQFDRAKLRVQTVDGLDTLTGHVAANTLPCSDVVLNVKRFSSLIHDEVRFVSDLQFVIDERQIQLKLGDRTMKMSPAFFNTLSRFIVTNTHIKSLSGTFLRTLGNPNAERGLETAKLLLEHLCAEFNKKFVTKDRQHKQIKLRMLKPDVSGVWPNNWAARAVLNSAFRDDISHLWLMEQLFELCPTGNVSDLYFDGDLLTGAMLLPGICRVEQESEYGGGLYFFSGEVGNRRAGVMPFVFRVRNRGVSVFDSSWHVTHNAVSNIDSLRSKLKDFVHEQIPLVDIAIEKLLALKTTIFTTDSEYALERLCIATASFFRGMLANKDIRLMAVATAAERSALNTSELSAFVVQNAFTRVARATDDHLRRIQLNMIAGKMVNLDWEKVAKVASGISDAQVCKVFKIKEEE